MSVDNPDALVEIIALREEWTVTALEKPAGKTEFDYGMACGIRRGLTMALNAIEGRIEEDAARSAEEEKEEE
jgi:hypothetical protein